MSKGGCGTNSRGCRTYLMTPTIEMSGLRGFLRSRLGIPSMEGLDGIVSLPSCPAPIGS